MFLTELALTVLMFLTELALYCADVSYGNFALSVLIFLNEITVTVLVCVY